MLQELPTRETEKTSTTLRHLAKGALILGVMNGWSQQEKIAVLQGILMDLSNPKSLSGSVNLESRFE